jgi:hypothetical protein
VAPKAAQLRADPQADAGRMLPMLFSLSTEMQTALLVAFRPEVQARLVELRDAFAARTARLRPETVKLERSGDCGSTASANRHAYDRQPAASEMTQKAKSTAARGRLPVTRKRSAAADSCIDNPGISVDGVGPVRRSAPRAEADGSPMGPPRTRERALARVGRSVV